MSLIKLQAIDAPLEALDRMSRPEEISAAGLHERYLTDVFHYVLRRVPRQEEAEDITAEVFAAAYVGLPRFRGQCPPYLWLLSIARRKIVDSQRRRAARRETLASELTSDSLEADPIWQVLAAVEGPEAALMRAEAHRMLRELVAQLNPDQREALLMHHMERLSVAEIALVMGRSAASVKSLLQRARATLRRRGQGYFGAEEGNEP